MAKASGDIKAIRGAMTPSGPGPMMQKDHRGIMRMRGAAFATIAASIDELLIGDKTFNKIWTCTPEVLDYLREGDKAAIYYFTHLLKQKIIIGVKSTTGPSWGMPFWRFIVLFICYFTAYPIIWTILAALVLTIPPSLLGLDSIATIGLFVALIGTPLICALSGFRLAFAWRQMVADGVAADAVGRGDALVPAKSFGPLPWALLCGAVGAGGGIALVRWIGDDISLIEGVRLWGPIGLVCAGLGFLMGRSGKRK